MAEYAQPSAVTRRVRFFDGQFLVDQDFVDEQKYHIDRERRLGKVLRITGVVDGLTVGSSQVNTVKVTAGTAIDSDGRQIVLAQDRTIDLPATKFNDKQGVRLLILYREQEVELATTGIASERRWQEEPQILAIAADGQSTAAPWNDKLPTVLLAQLKLDNRGAVTVDATVAHQAGLRLPGAVGIGTAPGDFKLNVNGRSRLGGMIDFGTQTVVSVAPGTVQFDAPGIHGGRLAIDGGTGNVGIGKPDPRTRLDTGIGLISGATTDYVRAHFLMTGGGKVVWRGMGDRLSWDTRFIAISGERGSTFSSGYVDINQPKSDIPKENVHDGVARSATPEGVILHGWEALYAVHPVGGNYLSASELHIKKYTTSRIDIPSNWMLVAIVNGDDGSVKLGTGVIIAPKTTSKFGSPLPSGTILMWSGSTDNIPGGWALCDGDEGKTPDLRSRFLVGAGSDYKPGAKGDADTHRHQVTIPTASFTSSRAGDHSHTWPAEWYDRSFALGSYHGIDRGPGTLQGSRLSQSGHHDHSVEVKFPALDSTNTAGNRPRWYALCFIMKL